MFGQLPLRALSIWPALAGTLVMFGALVGGHYAEGLRASFYAAPPYVVITAMTK